MSDGPHAAETTGWWRRNRAWLLAALVLGVLAFYLPWRINQRELDRNQPRTAIPAAGDAWSDYEGARWRIVRVRHEAARAGSAADYQHPDATLLRVDYEVVPGADVDARRLDQCEGRLVDASGREWEANLPPKLSTWMVRRGLDGSCGSRVVGDPDAAVRGKPFAFTHVYLVPADVAMDGLSADIFFPPFTTRPRMGTYLRFALPAPRA